MEGRAGLDRAGAYDLLGLEPGADPDRVRARYLELARSMHPDHGGSEGEMAELADAYALLTAESRIGKDLVQSASGEVVRMPTVVEVRAERREHSARVLQQALRHRTSSIKRAQRQSKWAAIASGGVALLVALARTLGLDTYELEGGTYAWLSSTARSLIFACFAALGLFLAFLTWRASARIAWLESALEDLGDALSDKNSYLQMIEELRADGGLGEGWSRAELSEALGRWSGTREGDHRRSYFGVARTLLGFSAGRGFEAGVPLRSLARIPDRADLANLVISKGLELELIAERRLDGAGFSYILT